MSAPILEDKSEPGGGGLVFRVSECGILKASGVVTW